MQESTDDCTDRFVDAHCRPHPDCGVATAALAPAVAAESTAGLISGAAGVPATSITNQLGSEFGSSLRESK